MRGWFSGLLLDGDIEQEKDRVRAQMDFFIAAKAPWIVYGETARSIQGVRWRRSRLSQARRRRDQGVRAQDDGLRGMVRGSGHADRLPPPHGGGDQTVPELDLLMANSGEALPLLFDAGHMAFAGGDVLRVIDKHHARISHVHTKDVRRSVINALDRTRESFLDAVVKGAFTVPGDGSLDFAAIVSRLASHGYEGWFVVEAEQDRRSARRSTWPGRATKNSCA